MADGDDKKDPHQLGDHLLGTNVIHQHEPGAAYDHDHDHFEFDEDGPGR